ncbi:uncharacterized protein LOC141836893 [Curcuma longa]|uniref:uncharacterized protein LOC141836893 n=1 Tax=Curcuma longa TaxID=136217 RepID=UPI003D9E4BB5
MHLWPSLRIRDAFKRSYIDKVERNLHRMKQQRGRPHASSSSDPIVAGSNPYKDPPEQESVSLHNKIFGLRAFCGELLLLFSRCFCCGETGFLV